MTEPTREQLLAEGRKQARIHDMQPATVAAEVYAEGWAAATARADRAVEEAQRAADKSLWDATFNADLVHKGRIAELEQRVKQVTALERMASQHASRCDANVAEADHRLALAKAEIAGMKAAERRMYADLLDEKVKAESELAVLQERIAKVREMAKGAASNWQPVARLIDPAELLAALDGEGEPR